MKQLKVMANDEWWNGLSEQAQEDYIALNPNSRQARDRIEQHSQEAERQLQEQEAEMLRTQEEEQRSARERLELLERQAKEQQSKPRNAEDLMVENSSRMREQELAFFREQAHKAGSEKRKIMAELVRLNAKGIVAHLRDQTDSWRVGVQAMCKMSANQALSSQEQRSLATLLAALSKVSAAVATRGGYGRHLMRALSKTSTQVIKAQHLTTTSASGEEAVVTLVRAFANHIETHEVQAEAWEHAFEFSADNPCWDRQPTETEAPKDLL